MNRAMTGMLWNGRMWIAVAALVLIVLTPVGAWLTATMVTHVLIQIPLLVAIGYVIGADVIHVWENDSEDRSEAGHHRYEGWRAVRLARFVQHCNAGGIPGILLTSFTLAFWMIPRWLDASLTSTTVEWAKYSSLVVLAGVPLALSWPRLHPIARGVVKIEFLSMLFRLGWLYLISPDRLCNNYLLNDQIWLGRGMILVAVALSITWLIPVFFGEVAAAPAVSNSITQKTKAAHDPRVSKPT